MKENAPVTSHQSPITRLKVLTVVGTRPEIIRLSEVIKRLDESEAIEHILVHTGQNYDYELNEVFFQDLGLRKPDHFLNAAGTNATTTIGQIIINIDPVLEKEQPDAFLVLGDTNSCLCAIPAKKRHIPIFHMEAGNRCFDQRVPEETNRKIVDHISDINLTYSDIAREYLLREGLPADRIIKTGSPMFEVLTANMDKIDNSDVLSKLSIEKGNYFVVSAHREENINSDNFDKLVYVLNQIAVKYQLPIIVSTHPRTRNKINEKGIQFNQLIQLMKPLGFHDYNHLQKNAKVVLSDSGTISEESSIMNFRALNIREAHERPEAMEEASVMMVGLNPERIMQGLVQLQYQKNNPRNTNYQSPITNYQLPVTSHQSPVTSHQSPVTSFRPVGDYSMPNVSDKVVRIILSYTDYIKRIVWSKKT
jgi:UDP-N-acetylglucosamine 2-epimerase (non-hydrolysing)